MVGKPPSANGRLPAGFDPRAGHLGVGPGQPVHFYYQVAAGGQTTWLHGVGTGWVVNASAGDIAGTYVAVEGIPIFFPAAALAVQQTWSDTNPCLSAVIQGFIAGVTGRTFGY